MGRVKDPLEVCVWLWAVWAAYWYASSWRVAATVRSEGRIKRLEHFAPTALAFWLLFAPPAGPLRARLVFGGARFAGIALAAAGFSFCVWARVHLGRYWSAEITLKEGHQLIRTGPYALARHPIYTGFLAAILGTAVAGGRAAGLLAFLIAVATYLRKLRREEAGLLEKFGGDYRRYMDEVGALLPRARWH